MLLLLLQEVGISRLWFAACIRIKRRSVAVNMQLLVGIVVWGAYIDGSSIRGELRRVAVASVVPAFASSFAVCFQEFCPGVS